MSMWTKFWGECTIFFLLNEQFYSHVRHAIRLIVIKISLTKQYPSISESLWRQARRNVLQHGADQKISSPVRLAPIFFAYKLKLTYIDYAQKRLAKNTNFLFDQFRPTTSQKYDDFMILAQNLVRTNPHVCICCAGPGREGLFFFCKNISIWLIFKLIRYNAFATKVIVGNQGHLKVKILVKK